MVTSNHVVHIIDEMKMGGAQTHLVTMLRHLQKNYPYRHTVISLLGSGPIADILHEMQIDVIVLDLRQDFRHIRFVHAVNKIRKLLVKLQPDLVEAHLTWSRLLGLLAARFTQSQYSIGFEQGDIYLNSIKFRVANFISQIYTDQYIVCSHTLREWVNNTHHIPNKKLNVFHNCVDVEKFHQYVTPADDVLELKTSTNTLFVMVGTLGRGVNKRVDIGIRAITIAREQGVDASLIIAGDGDQRTDLERLAEDLGVASFVHFLGMRSDIPNIMTACDVFCHAAPFEPFGIVAIEAMSSGLPAIVPDTGGINEAVEANSTGIIYKGLSPESLAQGMIKLSQDTSKREQMGKHAVQVVNAKFTVTQYVKQLYDLYKLS